jgi:hypothetical protein
VKREGYEFFRNNGYLELGQVLSDDEATRYAALFEREREMHGRFWRDTGIWQTIYGHALLTAPEFDGLIRHPKIIEPLQALMGGEVCFSEICLRHMGPYAGEPVDALTSWDGPSGYRWHRDGGMRFMWEEHPLRMGLVAALVYLADVSEATHSFSISPEAADDEILSKEDRVARSGVRELHGRAGTVVLFNVSVLHTVTVRPTKLERKTAQIGYGHLHRGDIEGASASVVPASLWSDHPDEETRRFYGVLNSRTRKFGELTADRDELPADEALDILADL